MTQILEIQQGGHRVAVEIDDHVTLESTGTADVPAGDLQLRVLSALANPEGFLPLTELLVPGDHFAIALETGVPQAAAVVQAVLQAVAGSELGKIEVVVSESMDQPQRELLRASLPGNVLLTVHRANDRSSLRYLAADEQAEAIRLNSSVVDADFVLPINVMRASDPLAGGPCGDALFPGLVDEGQILRLQRSVLRQVAERDELDNRWAADQAEQVRWALGVQLMVAVEIAPQEDTDSSASGSSSGALQVAGRVIAAAPETLTATIQQSLTAQNAAAAAGTADVVVACVEGDASQHSMQNLVRAALTARSYAAPGGAIVLVSDLDQLQFAHRSDAAWHEDSSAAAEAMDADSSQDSDAAEDAVAESSVASQAVFAGKLLGDLVNQVDSGRRYLLWSRCADDQVEAFGLGVLPNVATLERLINQAASCRVLRVAQTAPDAQRLVASEA